jgi:hypothetical protein
MIRLQQDASVTRCSTAIPDDCAQCMHLKHQPALPYTETCTPERLRFTVTCCEMKRASVAMDTYTYAATEPPPGTPFSTSSRRSVHNTQHLPCMTSAAAEIVLQTCSFAGTRRYLAMHSKLSEMIPVASSNKQLRVHRTLTQQGGYSQQPGTHSTTQ